MINKRFDLKIIIVLAWFFSMLISWEIIKIFLHGQFAFTNHRSNVYKFRIFKGIELFLWTYYTYKELK